MALHGGAAGLRDEGLHLSALERPEPLLAYGESANIIAMASAYTAGILRNHPVVEATSALASEIRVLFLELSGYRFKATEADAAQMVIALVAGEIDERTYSEFLRNNAVASRKSARSQPGKPESAGEIAGKISSGSHVRQGNERGILDVISHPGSLSRLHPRQPGALPRRLQSAAFHPVDFMGSSQARHDFGTLAHFYFFR